MTPSSQDKNYLQAVNDALIRLGIPMGHSFKEADIEAIRAAYGQKSRFYHGNDHGEGMALEHSGIGRLENGRLTGDLLRHLKTTEDENRFNALKTLIGMWHDVVYYAVDGFKVAPVAKKTMERYFQDFAQGKEKLTLKSKAGDENAQKILQMAQTLFGFAPGTEFNTANPGQSKGFNELASALVAADKMLELGLDIKTIAIVMMGIAATVPFEPRVNGDHMDVLVERLRKVSYEQRFALSDEELNFAGILATDIANQDVLGFAGNLADDRLERARNYLRGSWRMIAELNPSLRDSKNTVGEYFDGVKGMAGFTNGWRNPANVKFLNPDTIFHEVQITSGGTKTQYPSKDDYALLAKHRDEVLSDAGLYMDMKVVSAGVVLAIAGNDADLAETMFGLNSSKKTVHLPISNALEEDAPEKDKLVYTLLRARGEDPLIPFDVERSITGEFMFARLNKHDREGAVKELKTAALALRDGNLTPEAYLEKVGEAIGVDSLRLLKEGIQTSRESGLANTRRVAAAKEAAEAAATRG